MYKIYVIPTGEYYYVKEFFIDLEGMFVKINPEMKEDQWGNITRYKKGDFALFFHPINCIIEGVE